MAFLYGNELVLTIVGSSRCIVFLRINKTTDTTRPPIIAAPIPPYVPANIAIKNDVIAISTGMSNAMIRRIPNLNIRINKPVSGNVLDIDHFSVVETEERISASIRWRFARRWFATLTWQRTDGEDIDNLGRDQVETEVERISFSMRRRLR